MVRSRGPVLIDEDEPRGRHDTPGEAPPVPDGPEVPSGEAMRTMAVLAARKPTVLGRWFWRSLVALFLFVLAAAGWAAFDALMARNVVLGWVFFGIAGLFTVTCLGLCVREIAALLRLSRVGDIHDAAAAALSSGDLEAARAVTGRVTALYEGREALEWGRARFEERRGDVFDSDQLFALAERELLVPLDMAARAEVEGAARQVATVTAIVPLAFADVATALLSNLRMIRRIAEIYGGRAGTVGSIRLTRAVLTHLVATGAVAVGDDLIGSVAGGSVLARVSRRFGEGIVNGALTARVGVAAMEVSRPLPFSEGRRPQVHRIVGRALSGLFPQSRGKD